MGEPDPISISTSSRGEGASKAAVAASTADSSSTTATSLSCAANHTAVPTIATNNNNNSGISNNKSDINNNNNNDSTSTSTSSIRCSGSDLLDNNKSRKRLSAVSTPLSRSSSPSRSVAFKEQVDLKSQNSFILEPPRSKNGHSPCIYPSSLATATTPSSRPTAASPLHVPSSSSSSSSASTTTSATATSTSTLTSTSTTTTTTTTTTTRSSPSTTHSRTSSSSHVSPTSYSSTSPKRRTPKLGPLPRSDSAWSAASSAFDSPGMDRCDSFTSQKSAATPSCGNHRQSSPTLTPIATPTAELPSPYGYFGLQALISWLREHPSSSTVDSEQLARFLVVKSTSLLAAASGCFYGQVFDRSSSHYISLFSLFLLVIPAVQGATGATRACGLWLSVGIALLVYGFQSRSAVPLLGPSVEAMALIGLPVITGFLIGRKYGLLTAFMVLLLSMYEYRSLAQNTHMSVDGSNRLWASFGAYWVSLIFISSVTCIYQWSVEVCVKDVNLFKDLAVANAKSKDGVVSSVSHELRTPLAALIGWTELLLSDQTLSASARSTVSMLHSSTLSLLTILNALLDVSKVSAAKMTICDQNFNLHDLVLDTSRMMSGLSGTRNVELLVDYSAQVPELVRADCGIIKQILGNLVSNAIKFTDKGYVNVGVSLKDEDDDSVTVEFVVQDTGKGIPDGMKDRLFCEFSQVEGGKCKGYEPGTGLGLFLVKSLVELMKGRVFMSSELGVGSTFGFIIKMEKQYLAFRTPGYDHVVTVSSAFPGGITQTTTEVGATVLPVTPGLARSMTPMVSEGCATGATGESQDSNQPKDYFTLKPSEETRANANNITLRTRDNAFLTNRRYYVHSQCSFFEDFLWATCETTWNARATRRLSFEECVDGWRGDGVDANALQLFGDIFLIDLSPTTNRPKSLNELTDQEHIQDFLTKMAVGFIERAKARIGKVRQSSIVLFYPFGHPPSLVQEPFVELAKYYQISLCRKPVTERALGTIIKRQVVTVQSPHDKLPPSPVQSWPVCSGQLLTAAGFMEHLTADKPNPLQQQKQDQQSAERQSSTENMAPMASTCASVESQCLGQNGLAQSFDTPQENTKVLPAAEQPSSSSSSQSSSGSSGAPSQHGSLIQDASEQDAFDQVLNVSMEDFKLKLPKSVHRNGSAEKLSLSSNESSVSSIGSKAKPANGTPSLTVICNGEPKVEPSYPNTSSSSSSSTTKFESAPTMVASPMAASVGYDESPTVSPTKVQDPSSGCSSSSSSPPTKLMASGEPRRVLIVDDNTVNRQLLFQQLRKLDVLEVDQASSGEEAVAKFQPGTHMLVLMDLKMPNMNGVEAATLLREKEGELFGPGGTSAATMSDDDYSHVSRVSSTVGRLENGPCERVSADQVNDPFSQAPEGGRLSANNPDQVCSLVQKALEQEQKGQMPKRATIIAVTADWSAEVGEDREKTLDGGFDDVMVKPISLPELRLLLNRFTKE
ncbi:hypothetical protein DFQ27_006144 [Actinomortierella ambigua]|uniref:histidine kinase n=1 Tax=Actinomortierella ambigua TaxID=1343610 RepID=A0A9P6QH30_9FUNG|nr:hypothetical protein DFQ27_006144 [Actinomortierella ambigua]